jgi:hypothetical protein
MVGGSVQPPQPLNLLAWLWTRGPLLISWHFYLGFRARTRDASKLEGSSLLSAVVRLIYGKYKQVQLAIWYGSIAVALSTVCQIIITVAVALLAIPIGKWRRTVASTARILTLTLGDSYVLLEHEIQRAALVERV